MAAASGSRSLLLVLGIAVVGSVLAAEVVLMERWRHGVKENARAAPQPEEAERSEFWRPPDELVAAGAIDEMIERPLFLPTRRPPEPLPEKEPEPEPKKDVGKLALRLTSTIITENGAAAIFSEKGSDKSLVMRSGDEYKGWTVVAILPHAVLFKADELEREIRIRPSGPPPSSSEQSAASLRNGGGPAMWPRSEAAGPA